MPSPLAFGLAGTGVYLPPAARIGAVERPRAGVADTSSAMAEAAARAALADAERTAATLDAVIGGCSVMEQPIPGTALLVQRRLGLGAGGTAAFDVNATCLSGLLAMDAAISGAALGRWRRALAVAADVPSAAIDPDDAALAATFGDGAAAVLIDADGPHRLLASRIESYGDHADLCALEAGGTRVDPRGDRDAFLAAARFRMRGPALYRATARVFPAFLDRLLDAAEVRREEIACVVPHQASAAALAHLRGMFAGGSARYVDIFAQHGNQVAGSLLHALHVARGRGWLAPGSTALIVGSAAGVSLGGMVVRW